MRSWAAAACLSSLVAVACGDDERGEDTSAGSTTVGSTTAATTTDATATSTTAATATAGSGPTSSTSTGTTDAGTTDAGTTDAGTTAIETTTDAATEGSTTGPTTGPGTLPGETGLDAFCRRYVECGGTYYDDAQACIDASLGYWGECPSRRAALDAFGSCMADLGCDEWSPDAYNPASTPCAGEWGDLGDSEPCD